MYMALINRIPSNMEELRKKANNKNDWGERLNAIKELKKYDCQQSRDILTRLALHDRVFKIKEEAFRACQTLGIQKGGKPIFLAKKDIGYKNKDFTKTFQRVKRESKMEELDLEEFKEKFKQLNPEMYDVMKYEKANKFDDWIMNIYKGLPKK